MASKNFKEWIGKTLVARILQRDEELKNTKRQLVCMKRLCENLCKQTGDDQLRIMALVQNGFKVYKDEQLLVAPDEMLRSLSSWYGWTKSYDFKIVNNERVPHGGYLIMDANSQVYWQAVWKDGELISSQLHGVVMDTITNKPFYEGCFMKKVEL